MKNEIMKNEMNKIQTFEINGEKCYIVSGVKDKADVLAINMTDDEYDSCEKILHSEMYDMCVLGEKMMNIATKNNIHPKDVYNYVFNQLLWNM